MFLIKRLMTIQFSRTTFDRLPSFSFHFSFKLIQQNIFFHLCLERLLAAHAD